MILTTLALENFGPFRKPTAVDLNSGPGLIHLTGDNQESPRLGANGVGKSKLLDALYWCLYGKTSRGLKGASIRSWDSKGKCSVSIAGEWQDEERHYIERTANPNTLRIDERDVQQSEVNELVGLNEDEFLHSVYFSQFEDKFIDLKPTAQLELFSSVMDLQVWEQASARASDEVKNTERDIVQAEKSLAQEEGRIEVLSLAKEQAQDLETRWGREHLAKVKAAKQEAEKAGEWMERLSSTSGPKPTAALEKQVREASNSLATIRADLKREESRRLKLTMSKRNCPECGQEVTLKHQQEIMRESQAVTKELEQKEMEAAKKLNTAEQELTTLQRANKTKEENKHKVEAAHTEYQNANKKWDEAKQEKNPHTKQAEEAAAELEEAHLRAAKAQKDLAKMCAAIERERYWVKGFRDLRLWVIDDSLTQLEVEVNGAMHEVGLEGWSMEFDVERETKSGGVSRGFIILVQSPDNADPVPWESWSGGESQRLRLASTIGVANLIRARRGVDINVEFWDEPSSYLSEEGIEDMLSILESRASEHAVIIADHRTLSYGNFAGTLCVVKKEKGGSYVQ